MPESPATQNLPEYLPKDVAYYLAGAIFTDVEEEYPELRVGNFDDEAIAYATQQVMEFKQKLQDNLSPTELTFVLGKEFTDPGQLGLDLWFTQNGHGVGFWSRDELWGDELGDRMSELVTRAEKLAYVENGVISLE